MKSGTAAALVPTLMMKPITATATGDERIEAKQRERLFPSGHPAPRVDVKIADDENNE